MRRPRVLTIAGSDSGGGAGIQADLKTFAAHGVYGLSVVTALTAQNTRAVTAVEVASPSFVRAQLDAVLSDIEVDAIKVGMLATRGVVEAVAEGLEEWFGSTPPPLVLDPVMVAESGDPLLREDAVAALHDRLLPLATLVTPNLPEARRMTGSTGESIEERWAMGEALAGPRRSSLIKGGHALGDGGRVIDLLLEPAGAGGFSRRTFEHARIDTRSTHGTGCTLSSAIAARLARRDSLAEAVHGAILYLRRALAAAEPLGQGHGPVDHLVDLAPSP